MAERLTAYNMKTKEKGVPIFNAKINKTVKGARTTYIASGLSEDGEHKLNTILGEAKALEAIKDGVAEKGEGWD